jgi:uncharacterized protein YecT (DUF1311 family)
MWMRERPQSAGRMQLCFRCHVELDEKAGRVMSRITTYLFLTVSLLLVPPARAEDCAKTETQTDMNACAADAFKETDTKLNAVYREIIERLKDNEEAKQLLIKAQRVWLQYRDAECAFAASAARSGSIYPTILDNCLDGLTNDRVKALISFLKCEEGDMGCPVPPE